jgi:hypothetical protein
MMAVKDHGHWVQYIPTEFPKDAPTNALFARRKSDGYDWYEYVYRSGKFDPKSLKLTVRDGVISAPAVDVSMLFPAGSQVIELSGDYTVHTTDELIELFASKAINLRTGDVTDIPVPELPQSTVISEILDRLAKLENSK